MIDIGIHSTSIKSRMPNQWENTAKLSIEAPRNSKSDFSMSRRPPVSPTFVSSRLSISADVILIGKKPHTLCRACPSFFFEGLMRISFLLYCQITFSAKEGWGQKGRWKTQTFREQQTLLRGKCSISADLGMFRMVCR